MRQIHKLLAVIIAIMACVLVCPASTWADADVCPNSENGEHEWVYYNSADCVYEGTGSWQCIYCYKERDVEVTPPLGHDYIAEETTPATCEASGVMTYTCTRCGDSYRETIPATGHVWDNGTVTREPGCEEPGEIIYTCVVCGGTIINSIPPFYHDFSGEGVITKEADCLSTGIIAYTCKNCGEVYEETIPIGSHNWDAGTVTQPATCTENGVYTYTCTVCGTTRTETIAAYGHTPVTVAGWPATCTASGMTEGSSCSVCGAVLTAQTEIPATGHNWDAGKVTQEATCTENGVYTYTCHNCPKTLSESIPATGHSWNNGMVTREPKGFDPGIKTYTCSYCGETRGEEISPAKGLFSKLRNSPPGGMGPDPLAILEDPQGGAVARGSGSIYPLTHMMSVLAEGGIEPYSYEWHERSTALDAEMDEEKIAGITSATEEILKDIVDGYQWAMENWCAAWTYLYERIHGEIPEYEGEAISAVDQKLWDLLSVNDHIYEGTYFDKPTFIGSGGHTYYCVVTDAVGQKAVSQLAEVRNAVSIRTEYGSLNKNMFSGNKSLF